MVTVVLNGIMIAATTHAIMLHEEGYKARAYIPREEVIGTLKRTTRTTHCPFKGDATYYDVIVSGETIADAAWSYDAPFDEMAAIEGHVAFDDRFDISVG
ncbi:DUF427 domain-containing protein [Acuticoccus sp. MNP-M23]|uniref:DUF427 domain-containing protein n=1 Tax=Acuticoccus sp. MNP-M23 TaxID=3072793 RepID=UPI002816615F|nr:DUF427 domain-containing protein [Acuticoccus sp. MNP-M23]WMS43387.1 DUF427 domain-containing protein [Acuticoccus sp. MNP-M23]